MPTISIENFRHGLDTRRGQLNSSLGVLETLENAFINQGAEIEKRKAFVSTALAGGPTVLYVVPLKDSIVLLGGAANGVPSWPASVSSLLTYQRLYRGINYDAAACVGSTTNYCGACADWSTASEATEVLYARSFDNKVFALARMADSSIQAFYDGAVIKDINYWGLSLTGMGNPSSNLKMFCQLVEAIQETGEYTVDITDTLDGILITSQPGRKFLPTFEGTWCSGTPTIVFTRPGTPATPGKRAFAYFHIEDGVPRSGINQITAVEVGVPGGGTVTWTNLLSAAVNYQRDPETTAAAIVENINAVEGNAYDSSADGNTVTIRSKSDSSTTNGYLLRITVSSFVMINKCSLAFHGTGMTVNSLKVDGTNILPTTYVFPTVAATLSLFTAHLASEINTGTGTHGYVAMSRDNVLKISKKVTVSDPSPTATDGEPKSTGMLPVTVDWTPTANNTGEITDDVAVLMQVSIEPTDLAIKLNVGPPYPESRYNEPIPTVGGPFIARVVGGQAPYRYKWGLVSSSVRVPLLHSPNSESTLITGYVYGESYINLEVTDATGLVAFATPAKLMTLT